MIKLNEKVAPSAIIFNEEVIFSSPPGKWKGSLEKQRVWQCRDVRTHCTPPELRSPALVLSHWCRLAAPPALAHQLLVFSAGSASACVSVFSKDRRLRRKYSSTSWGFCCSLVLKGFEHERWFKTGAPLLSLLQALSTACHPVAAGH